MLAQPEFVKELSKFSIEIPFIKEEEELNLQELQELVRDLSKRVAKLECHHAKF